MTQALYLKVTRANKVFFFSQNWYRQNVTGKPSYFYQGFFFHEQKYFKGKTKLSKALIGEKVFWGIKLRNGNFFTKVSRKITGTKKVPREKIKCCPGTEPTFANPKITTSHRSAKFEPANL